ncbi:MAG: histidine triad nucleotide-binding protein [Candidatus Margulisbacteria bacterium]|nr:histidine triad nucleotide-binding protein [Candidatus Margulisiibacteriota bacterium]
MMTCLFCRIIKKELPASIVYEDDKVLAFNDIAPQAPVHILVIPKEHVDSLSAVKDHSIFIDLMKVVNKVAVEQGIDKSGFRTVINNGRAAGMAVDHLHIHVLGGRGFNWPPG